MKHKKHGLGLYANPEERYASIWLGTGGEVLYETTVTPSLVVDRSRRVWKTNGASELLTGQLDGMVRGHRVGEVLGCAHSGKTPWGCGTSTECASCPLRGAIEACLEHDAAICERELEMVLGWPRQTSWVRVVCTVTPLAGDARGLAFLELSM